MGGSCVCVIHTVCITKILLQKFVCPNIYPVKRRHFCIRPAFLLVALLVHRIYHGALFLLVGNFEGTEILKVLMDHLGAL